jgi:hypothetical protein
MGMVLALGSRGLTSAPLLAELVVAQLLGEPAPLPQPLLDALAPQRLTASRYLTAQQTPAEQQGAAERALVEDADFTLSALFIMLLMAPVLMAWWFAPVLAAWHRLGVGKALFFSFIACWMNWRPFLVYGLGLLIVAGILPGVLLGILLLVMPGAANLVTALVTMPMVLVIAPTIFASFYASYRDIFGISEIV